MRDGPVESDIGNVSLHLSKETHSITYLNEYYFDSFGCGPSNKLSNFIKKRNGHCLYSEYKKQGLTSKRDFYCSAHCL